MIYKSKKDETLTAKVVSTDEKCNTCILEYLSGDKVGKTIALTNSTLKRWWKKVDEPKTVDEILGIDNDVVNTKYPEPKVQKYIPKPKSVIEYEEKKKRTKCDLPDYESLKEIFANVAKKLNSSYIILKDETSIFRLTSFIRINAPEKYMEEFSELGLTGSPNKDNKRPLTYVIKSLEDFENVKEILLKIE